jgi:epoxyqueuosine reductase QueG
MISKNERMVEEPQNSIANVEIVGFAPIKNREIEKEWAKTIIILGTPLLLPIIETCPSIWGLEQEKITRNLLLKEAHKMMTKLFQMSERAVLLELDDWELATFAQRAGLGYIGKNGRFVTDEFGMRVKLIAIATSLKVVRDTESVNGKNGLPRQRFAMTKLENKETEEIDICGLCQNCLKICPVSNDHEKCKVYNGALAKDYKNPCLACMKVCPIGKDRVLYGSEDCSKYFSEHHISSAEYKSWEHVRSYGSIPHGKK